MSSNETQDWFELYMLQRQLTASAVECLRDIAALAGTTKRKQAGCEQAATWLYAHRYPLEPGGYVPGQGFNDEDAPSILRRQAE